MSERDYLALADQYRKDVLSRRLPAAKWVRLACRRQRDDLKRARRRGKPWRYVFEPWYANDVCGFVEKLPHVEGSWDSPTIVLEPWQCFVLTTIFGWRRRNDQGRRFNTVYLEVARKNAKSALSSAVALYCLCCEGEPGPQVKSAATTGKQARIVFDVARKMLQKTPDLQEAFGLEPFKDAIACYDNNGTFEPINAKSSTQDGLNPHLSILDELHAHKTRSLFDVLKSARGARKNPMTWIVTTAGYDVEGVCFEQRTLLTKILEGLVEADHYFGIIYTLDEKDDPLDGDKWIKANPNLGVSVQEDELESYATEARYSPDQFGEFQTKRMNIWLTARGAWLNMTRWRQCDAPVDLEALVDVPCWGGLDLAATQDINALVWCWRFEGKLLVWPRFWLPEEVIRPRTERGNVPYQRWNDMGLLTATPGDVTDYAYIERAVIEGMSRFNVQQIGYDPWNATDLVNRLQEEDAPMVEVRQGPKSFNAAMKTLERAVASRTLAHGGHPVLSWMASNTVARKDVNENMAPDRNASKEKIDGIVAFLMGISRLIVNEDERSVYVTGERPDGLLELEL